MSTEDSIEKRIAAELKSRLKRFEGKVLEGTELYDEMKREIASFCQSQFNEGVFKDCNKRLDNNLIVGGSEKDSAKIIVDIGCHYSTFYGKTAYDLREIGFQIEQKVPDCAVMTPRGFEWTDISFTVGEDGKVIS